jgi:hypothetical protein
MGWTETGSLSFTARHESTQSDAALAVLESLESHRAKLEDLFPEMPANVTVVLHDSALQMSLAQPVMMLARRVAAPAARRYMAGWFAAGEIHALSPSALRDRAAGPESLQALMLTPERAYTALVIGSNNPTLPPPFRPSTFRSYWRRPWLAEGAAQYFSGQLPYLRAAIARRMRGTTPSLPPGRRDAALLGGAVYDLLARERGEDACVALATGSSATEESNPLESAFGRPAAELRGLWVSHLAELAKPRSVAGRRAERSG